MSSFRTPARVVAFAVAVTGPAIFACAPSSAVDREATEERYAPLRAALAAYDSAGFLAGPAAFPVVGRPFVLPGPDDSVYLGFAASMPPAALRFAREGDLVAARYQVVLRVRSGTDTLARIERREVVRLKDFSETTSEAPRVVFQRFVKVPIGRLQLDVVMRELTSRLEAERTFDVEARDGLSEPLVAYSAEARSSRAEAPSLLVSPRSVAYTTQAPPEVLIEDGSGGPGFVVLYVIHEGFGIREDTLRMEVPESGAGDARSPPLVSVVTALPVHLLPPGRASLRAKRPGRGGTTVVPLYIGLAPEWTFQTWRTSLASLAYALDADTLQRWSAAQPRDHATLWRRFRKRTDPDPETPANEFLVRYFDRMNRANDRFDEPGRAGWETDRGEVLVKLGEPDDEHFIPPEREGEVPRIEWEYGESVPTSALIVFEDTSDFGVFVMTPRSRAVLRGVMAELASTEGPQGEGARPPMPDD